jgi:hypothetical protein
MVRLPLLALVLLWALPAAARDACRPPRDLPPGVSWPDRPGCPPRQDRIGDGARPGRLPGFVDVGGSTQVRITGRTRVEAGASR